jgi:hypothetical protein
MIMAVGTGLLFGLFPALHSTRADLISGIKANASQPAGARAANRFRASLVTVQVALSMALLVSAGLFIKSLRNVSRVDLGINAENVVAFGLSPQASGYDSTRAHQLFARVEEEFTALVEDLVGALDKFNVPKKEKDELLGALGPLAKEIVNPPPDEAKAHDAALAKKATDKVAS